jgi:hypothetical protein
MLSLALIGRFENEILAMTGRFHCKVLAVESASSDRGARRAGIKHVICLRNERDTGDTRVF